MKDFSIKDVGIAVMYAVRVVISQQTVPALREYDIMKH